MKAMLWIGVVPIWVLTLSCPAFGQRVSLPEGTAVPVRLKADLTSDKVAEGSRVDFEVAQPVVIEGMTVIPEGAVAWGAIQSVKKGKFIKFDIEGVRLPDRTDIKLRSVRTKAKNPGQDEIKVESSFKGGVGAAQGTEYTAYVDQSKEVATSGPPTSSALTAAPAPAPVQAAAPPAPAQVGPSSPASVTSTTPAAPPAASPAISPAQSTAPLASVERIKVECFSDPSDADILIDGEFYGNTPSILKVPVGKHQLQIQLSGYKTFALSLNLEPDMEPRTIRASLEPKE
jgi:hypothetical protein